jgi:hypothetical protein
MKKTVFNKFQPNIFYWERRFWNAGVEHRSNIKEAVAGAPNRGLLALI